MAQQQKLKESDEQLHWFWKVTTKWWFFPLFYFLSSLIFTIFFVISTLYPGKGFVERFLDSFLANLVLTPTGLGYYFLLPTWIFLNKSPLSPVAGLFFLPIAIIIDIYLIFSVILIYYNFSKKNKILKWLIILNIMLILLSYLGLIFNYFIYPIEYSHW